MGIKHYLRMRKLRGKERMSAGVFWSECAMQAISYFCAVIIMMIIVSVTVQADTERLTEIASHIALAMVPLWCVPIARNSRYRLRDAGYSAKAYLWLLLPVIGWIVFIVLLCKKGLPRKGDGTLLI